MQQDVRRRHGDTKNTVAPKGKGSGNSTTETPAKGGKPETSEMEVVEKEVGISRVFCNVVQYLAALFVYSIMFISASGHIGKPGTWQLICQVAWQFHYFKRVFESMFIHVYSSKKMPWLEGLAEIVYYAFFGGFVGYHINLPTFEPPPLVVGICGVLLFLVGESINFKAHTMLADMRYSTEDEALFLPTGFLFSYVSVPHYFGEILSWAGFYVMTQTLGSLVFLGIVFVVLLIRGVQRHERYKMLFDGRSGRPQYPKSRKAVIPFII